MRAAVGAAAATTSRDDPWPVAALDAQQYALGIGIADLERDNLRDAQSCAVTNAWRRAYRRRAVGPCTTPGLRNVEKHVFWTTDLGKIERPELGKAPGSFGVRQNGAQCVPRPSKTI
jgi:hypothetical protein